MADILAVNGSPLSGLIAKFPFWASMADTVPTDDRMVWASAQYAIANKATVISNRFITRLDDESFWNEG